MKVRFSVRLSTMLMFFLTIVFFSCSKEEKDSSASKESENEMNWELSEEEQNDNWKSFKEIGFKVHMPKEISEKKDVILADRLGDDETEDYPIYGGYLYAYYSETTKKAYNAIIENEEINREDKIKMIETDITPNIKEIFALLTLRANLVTEGNTIEKILQEEELKFETIEEVGRDNKYIYLVAFSNGKNIEGLSEEDAKEYKTLVEIAPSIKEGLKTAMPVSSKAALTSVTGLTFDTLDLEGKQVTSEVLKDAKVTMVNIWATWCPPCKAELPDIGRLAKNYKEKGGQVIAICSDVTDEDTSALEEAKDIIKDAECDSVIVLRKNKTLDSIYANIRAFPTTLFFGADGNVIAPVIVGGRSEADFAKVFDECLEKVK